MRMLTVLLLSCTLLTQANLRAQSSDREAVMAVLAKQSADWNRGDIPAFMEGYWKSDSLLFVGSAGPQYGWNNTMQRYQRSYDSPEKMGQLRFDILQAIPLGRDHYFVLGKWHLTRSIGDVGGHFTLIFRRFAEGWKIVSDHTS